VWCSSLPPWAIAVELRWALRLVLVGRLGNLPRPVAAVALDRVLKDSACAQGPQLQGLGF
jgi:hypothetical protein